MADHESPSFPLEMIRKILSYLPPDALTKSAQVAKSWKGFSNYLLYHPTVDIPNVQSLERWVRGNVSQEKYSLVRNLSCVIGPGVSREITEFLQNLHRFEELETLKLQKGDDISPSQFETPLSDFRNTLQVLTLDDCRFSLRDLTNFVNLCKGLKHLRIRSPTVVDSTVLPVPFARNLPRLTIEDYGPAQRLFPPDLPMANLRRCEVVTIKGIIGRRPGLVLQPFINNLSGTMKRLCLRYDSEPSEQNISLANCDVLHALEISAGQQSIHDTLIWTITSPQIETVICDLTGNSSVDCGFLHFLEGCLLGLAQRTPDHRLRAVFPTQSLPNDHENYLPDFREQKGRMVFVDKEDHGRVLYDSQ